MTASAPTTHQHATAAIVLAVDLAHLDVALLVTNALNALLAMKTGILANRMMCFLELEMQEAIAVIDLVFSIAWVDLNLSTSLTVTTIANKSVVNTGPTAKTVIIACLSTLLASARKSKFML